ncbi:Rad2 nuclease [Coemansia sp. RSA 560]|nr:Rad2 nuclease [Coemansia sp. RSA 560]KAJ2290723.1 Rad2 nuclease [Coemansia sp. RSA 355]KAJ2408121.1 Rad2 nuclease [Coemansia sp. RSA 2526]
MGITGLLPLLSEAQRKGHVKEFSGQTVGIDSYIWLYKGAFSCAVEIGLNQPTTKYISFFMARAHMLRHHGIDPLFVFDGGMLPSKRITETSRHERRAARRARAMELWAQNKRSLAYGEFQKCLEATPRMARAVIDELKKCGFRYLVAPYEADAQLAYLERTGVVTAVVSEDSDLIAFGCRNVLFKMDQFGAAVVFDRKRLGRTRAVDVDGWSDAKIRRMCVLAGCDYAASVPGIGLKRAHRYVARSESVESAVALMRADGVCVPDEYEENAVRAELTFLYQRVYDPRSKCIDCVVPHTKSAPLLEEMPFIGEMLESRVAQRVAEAEIDPITYEPFNMDAPVVAALPVPDKAPVSQASPVIVPSPVARTSSVTTPSRVTAKPKQPRTLVSLWKKSAFAPISATPKLSVPKPEHPASCPPASSVDQPVHVKFRARDTHGATVATPTRSKFFAAAQVVESDDEVHVVQDTKSDPHAPHGSVVLFDQFRAQTSDIPEWMASPKYRKDAKGDKVPVGAQKLERTPVRRSKRLSQTPITQMARRISGGFSGDTIEPCNVEFADAISLFRCGSTSSAIGVATHVDIIDCSDSDKENTTCA